MRVLKMKRRLLEQKLDHAERDFATAITILRRALEDTIAIPDDPPHASVIEAARLEGWLAAIEAVSRMANPQARDEIMVELEGRCHAWFKSRGEAPPADPAKEESNETTHRA